MVALRFKMDPSGAAHRLLVTMNTDEVSWLLGLTDAIRVQVKLPPEPPTQGAPVPAPSPPPTQPIASERERIASERAHAKSKGYEGDPCNECGQFRLTRNGTCLKCDACGATNGCS